MAEIDTALSGARAAVAELITAAEQSAWGWTTPRAPGKWSPSQVVEHVARSLEESANVIAGKPSEFPTFPGFFRVFVRSVFFNRVVKNRTFPKARTTKPMDPLTGPPTLQDGRARVQAAFEQFDRECRASVARGGRVNSTLFGDISAEDYAVFQEVHTRHHRKQIPA